MRELLDEDGENQAVRAFLLLYGTSTGVTIGSMKQHMQLSGFSHWPDYMNEHGDGMNRLHLNKASAQAWLRHLFSLEQ